MLTIEYASGGEVVSDFDLRDWLYKVRMAYRDNPDGDIRCEYHAICWLDGEDYICVGIEHCPNANKDGRLEESDA